MEFQIIPIDDDACVQEVVRGILADPSRDDPFYLIQIEQLVDQFNQWTENLPRVHPFYAIKCNSSNPIVRTLATLGCGLDVATKNEIQRGLAFGVRPDLLVYSNTCKAVSHLLHAKRTGVDLTVFDSESELLKIKQNFPEARLLVRLRCDDESAAISMGHRFGCEIKEAEKLINRSQELNLRVVGVCFHVGCGSSDPSAYARAIAKSKILFNYASSKGLCFTILDIGGGFPGSMGNISLPFEKYSDTINKALEMYFPWESGVRVIAEPGQYFAASAQSVFTRVIGMKVDEESLKPTYILSDGMHGSFRDIVTFGLIPEIRVHGMSATQKSQTPKPCSLWGPTCDPMDRITESCALPDLEMGQWLEFQRMGAYTNELFCTFNDFPMPKTVVIVPRRYLNLVQ